MEMKLIPFLTKKSLKLKIFIIYCAVKSTHRHKKTPKIDVILFMKLIFKTSEDRDSLKIIM